MSNKKEDLPKYIKMVVYPYTSDALHYKIFKLADDDSYSETYGYVINYVNDYKEKYRASSLSSHKLAILRMKGLLEEEKDNWVESNEEEWLEQYDLQKRVAKAVGS